MWGGGRRLAAGEVTSESLAGRAWPRWSKFRVGALTCSHGLFRKDIYSPRSREHWTSVF